MAARAELKSKITLNASQFKKGVKESVAAGKGMESSFAAISKAVAGYFSFQAIAGYIRNVAAAVDNLKETALNVGAGYENWQAFKAIFVDLGQKADTGASALQKLNGTILQARGGTMAAVGAFDALGISVEELKRLDSAQAFARVAEGARAAGYSVQAMDAITDIFGARMVSKVMPALRKVGAEGFDALAEQAREAGLVMEEATVEAISDMTNAWEKFKIRMVKLGAETFAWWKDAWHTVTTDIDTLVQESMDEWLDAQQQRADKAASAVAEAEAATEAAYRRSMDALEAETEAQDRRAFEAMSDAEKIIELERQIEDARTRAADAAERQVEALAAAREAEEAVAAARDNFVESDKIRLDTYTNAELRAGKLLKTEEDIVAAEQAATAANDAAAAATKEKMDADAKIYELQKKLEPLVTKQADEAERAAAAAQEEADARERAQNAARDEAWAKVRAEEGRIIEENLTLDEKRAAAEQKRKVALEEQNRIQAQGLADSEQMAYWRLEQLKAERSIRELQEEESEQNDKNFEKLRGQLEVVNEFRDFLSGMSDKQLKKFTDQLKKLGDAVAGLDFSGLEGLAELGKIKLPGLSDSQAAAYVRAISTLVKGLSGLNVGNGFAWISDLSALAEIKLPGLSESQASQYVRALRTLVDGLSGMQPQGGFSWLSDLAAVGNLAVAGGGDLTITMSAPPAEDLLLRVDDGDLAVFKDLAKSAETIASAKGVIYQ